MPINRRILEKTPLVNLLVLIGSKLPLLIAWLIILITLPFLSLMPKQQGSIVTTGNTDAKVSLILYEVWVNIHQLINR